MKLFTLSLKFKGFPIDAANKDLFALQQMHPTDFWDYQKEQCWNIFEYHARNNSCYKSILQQRGIGKIEKWTDVPIVQKADMQVSVGSRLSDGMLEKDVYVNNTSGSSGVPFFFAKDRYCHARTWAVIMDRFGWHGIDFNTSWQARFYGIPFTWLKFLKEKAKDRISHRVRFPVFNMEDKVLAGYVKRFTKTKFEYLNGYTSSLVLFAKYCIAHGIVLKTVCPTLKGCFTTSEVCSPEDRNAMEKGFGVKVVNEYGAAELDIIAFEDKDGDWLLNEENVFVEILDDYGQPVPDGQSGRVIVTGMLNKAMPFIRYELGDVGAIEPGFRKGIYRKLKQLDGRVNDVAILPSGRKVPGLTFYYVTKSLLDTGGATKEFIIRQDTPTEFTVEYVNDNELSDAEREKVKEMMDMYMEPGLSIYFVRKDKIERTKAGKLRQFQSLVNPTT